ncbi:MAG: MBL fold metallo-hydrolase [Dehalococcoidia bacterium]|nr:MBL fold metallo-hydrolase [Dehalococcoidia bacterium]
MPVEITYLGRNCFRLKGRDGIVITDPCPPESGFTLGKQTAEVVTMSRRVDPGYSWSEGIGGNPVLLDAPGEYEIGGILVTGIATRAIDGSRNVVSISEIDWHPRGASPADGDGRHRRPRKDVDVPLLPVGGSNASPRTWRRTW